MASRHRSRELAVQFVYQMERTTSDLTHKALDNFWREQARASQEDRPFFELLVRGVFTELPAIDQVIEKHLQNWKFSRLEKVDLAVLRAAVFELLYTDDPEKPDDAVVINEALEIVKKFSTHDSTSFINGILDAISKERTRS